jgi:hypothetical protein
VAVLVAGALVLGGSHGKQGGGGPSATLQTLESKLLIIERRVEGIRGQDFVRRPLPVLVGAAEVRRAGLSDLDRLTPRPEQAANEELLKLLGLIPPQSSLRAINQQVFGEQVAGFYDPRTKKLALVKDTGAQDESVAEITLAHELTHALDDQRFGLRDQAQTTDDGADAYTALVEGDATAVMTRYATDFMSGTNLLGVLFASSAASSGPPLPQYIQDSLEFPYLEGERFIQTIYRYGRGWKLVNYAFRFRPPVSTAQILHPLLYARDVRPVRVPLRMGPVLGGGWRRVAGGTFGEFDTGQLLRLGTSTDRAAQIAAVWRGGRYELWRTGALPARGCAAPCRSRDVGLLAWRTAPGRDAASLAAGLGSYVAGGLGGRARGPGVWSLTGGAAAVSTHGDTTVLAFAPTPARAGLIAAVAGH